MTALRADVVIPRQGMQDGYGSTDAPANRRHPQIVLGRWNSLHNAGETMGETPRCKS